MTPGWKLTLFAVAIALLVIEAISPRVRPLSKIPVNLGWLGLALFVLPFAWDAGSL